jgi:tRNA dimethylallyltransferase
MSTDKNLIVLLGPTASGKTALAVEIACALDGEIISADSRQIYRRLDIGTGKDLKEYGFIPYHLIDSHEIGEAFSVAHFQKAAFDAINDVFFRGKQPILCGGTGLYIESLLANYQFSHVPHFLSEPLDIQFKYTVFGLNPSTDERREKITKRLQARLQEGMLEEVQQLLVDGVHPEELRWLGLEYKWMINYIEGHIAKDEFEKGLETAIHQFAKRQMTYFRKMERAGIEINWIPDTLDFQAKRDFILNFI